MTHPTLSAEKHSPSRLIQSACGRAVYGRNGPRFYAQHVGRKTAKRSTSVQRAFGAAVVPQHMDDGPVTRPPYSVQHSLGFRFNTAVHAQSNDASAQHRETRGITRCVVKTTRERPAVDHRANSIRLWAKAAEALRVYGHLDKGCEELFDTLSIELAPFARGVFKRDMRHAVSVALSERKGPSSSVRHCSRAQSNSVVGSSDPKNCGLCVVNTRVVPLFLT